MGHIDFYSIFFKQVFLIFFFAKRSKIRALNRMSLSRQVSTVESCWKVNNSNMIKIYWASTPSSRTISSEQMRLKQIIGGERLVVEWIDITTDGALLKEMRNLAGQEKALPPQIFHSNDYLGDVSMLNDAVEDGNLWQFLRLDRHHAVRYRELSNGKYEIIEPNYSNTESVTPIPEIKDEKVVPTGGIKMPCMTNGSSSSAIPILHSPKDQIYLKNSAQYKPPST